jgi:hypothetical protein
LARAPGADLGFSFAERKSGEVAISRGGRVVTTLRGARAAAFLARVAGASDAEAQHAMARATGQYARGNERLARAHPRHRG